MAGERKTKQEQRESELRKALESGGRILPNNFEAEQCVLGSALIDSEAALTIVGKLEEIALFCEINSIDLVIFDVELSPTQIRNIEEIVPCGVIGIRSKETSRPIISPVASKTISSPAYPKTLPSKSTTVPSSSILPIILPLASTRFPFSST